MGLKKVGALTHAHHITYKSILRACLLLVYHKNKRLVKVENLWQNHSRFQTHTGNNSGRSSILISFYSYGLLSESHPQRSGITGGIVNLNTSQIIQKIGRCADFKSRQINLYAVICGGIKMIIIFGGAIYCFFNFTTLLSYFFYIH